MSMMKKAVGSSITFADKLISRGYLTLFQEKASLIIFLFHGLFRNEKEIALNFIEPRSQRNITVDYFRSFVEYYLHQNYLFVSPEDVLSGLDNDRNYIMVTFDDGYYSNWNALPILEEYTVPAVFFISANHVKQCKCFWWDVIYRERIRSGNSKRDISNELKSLKRKTDEEIEKYIIDLFGEEAFEPKSDVDRPFTESELKQFANSQFVFLGNHTLDHAILTNYSSSDMKSQIEDSQSIIHEMTGTRPAIIAYPSGEYSAEVIRMARDCGMKLGLTIEPKKNYLPIDLQGDDAMCLGRFSLRATDSLVRQCEVARSDIVLYNSIRTLLRKSA